MKEITVNGAIINFAETVEEAKNMENGFNFHENAVEAVKMFEDLKYCYGNVNAIENTLFPAWWDVKTPLRNIFRHHSNWDERQQAIIFSASTYEEGINYNDIRKSSQWFAETVKKVFVKAHAVTWNQNLYEKIKRKYTTARDILEGYSYISTDVKRALVEQKLEWETPFRKLYEYRSNLSRVEIYDDDKREYVNLYLNIEDREKLDSVYCFFNNIDSYIETATVTEKFKERVEKFSSVNCVVGQKLSRVVHAICREYGIDKIKTMREIIRHGEPVMKDFGYEYNRAMFGDAVNPTKITKYTVISLNPFDYWNASNGFDWSSCHTIDKLNTRDMDNNYNGMYSGGTESYMLDSTSVVFYTVNADYNGDMHLALKDRRMMFHIDDSGKAFVFGRLYPDGRDGGELSFASQFRNLMQKVLADCLDFNNLWKINKGNCYDVTQSYGRHYRDYEHYGDCGYTYASDMETMPKIKIGHKAICPECGREHDTADNVFCDQHAAMEGDKLCNNCGCVITEDDYDRIYCDDNEEWYCCSSCANADDVYYCEDDDRWHTDDNCYRDDYDDRYYHYEDDRIDAEDGCTFSSWEHAESAGYRYVEDKDGWYRESEVFQDYNDDQWYLLDDYDYIKVGYKYFKDADSATEYGCVYNEETQEWELN